MLTHAKWIACEEFASPIVRRVFTAGNITSAKLYITGLGYFSAYLNGKPVTDGRFLPAQTDYRARDTSKFTFPILDHTRHRIHYLCFDVTHLLQDGENTLDILLGNGWYRQTVRKSEGDMRYGDELLARYALHVATEHGEEIVASDGSERYACSPILESNLYRGEKIDLRQKVEFTRRVKVVPLDVPLVPQDCPFDRIVQEITPVLLCRQGETCLYDIGVNVTGVAAVTADSPEGGEIHLTFAENLTPDRTDLDPSSTGGLLQEDCFLHGGGVHTFVPQFVFHCFRYFKITGRFSSVKVQVIHTDVAPIATFESDSPALNWLFRVFQRTLLNNLHGSIPSDCPHRERLGYTGDGQLTAEAAMYCFDLSRAYRKWILDIFDGQGESGHIQHTAPLQGGGGGPACWGGAAVVLPYQYYRFYGDRDFLASLYPGMVKWIGYMRSRREDGLIVREEKDGWCLGDWGSATRPAIDPAFVNTAYFAWLLPYAAELAELLGRPQDAQTFLHDREEAVQAVQAHYYDAQSGDYCGNVQFANIFALAVGLGDKRTAEHLCRAVDECGDILDIGIVAMDLMIHWLLRRGETDRALRAVELLTGHMRANGATTFWEYPYRQQISNCHHMFCGMVRSLFSELLGIRLSLDGSISFAPEHRLPAGVNVVCGSTVLRGKTVTSELRRTPDGIHAKQTVE